MTTYNVSFVGAGKVAGVLCRSLYNAGNRILRIVTPEMKEDGTLLARECQALWSSEPVFDESNDVIIIAVPDHSLSAVLAGIKCSVNSVVAHTAGSYGLDVFPEWIVKRGVFYPLQTFSKNRELDVKDIPFILEASQPETEAVLKGLAESLGGKTSFLDQENRRMLHLAAVFVNNFSNFMLIAGKEITIKAGLPFDLLIPLIKETYSKALANGPEYSQTGPAVRNDKNTIEKHMNLLSFSPELQSIYREISESIITYYYNHNRNL